MLGRTRLPLLFLLELPLLLLPPHLGLPLCLLWLCRRHARARLTRLTLLRGTLVAVASRGSLWRGRPGRLGSLCLRGCHRTLLRTCAYAWAVLRPQRWVARGHSLGCRHRVRQARAGARCRETRPLRLLRPLGSRSRRFVRHARMAQRLCRHAERCALHRPRRHKGVARNYRGSGRHAAINIANVVTVLRVAVVVDDIDVGHVVHVHVAHVGRAVAIPRNVRLTPAERHPAHGRAAAHAHRPVGAADECHQRRRVDRARYSGAGRPGPMITQPYPAAIVVRRESPRRVINPGPSPRRNPHPMPLTIRCPIRCHRGGRPYRAVFFHRAPRPVLIEVFIAGHFPRHITCRDHALVLPVACRSPVVEFVRRRCGKKLLPLRGQQRQLIVTHGIGRVVREHIGLTATHQHGGGRAGRIGVDTVVARLCEQHRAARRADLEIFSSIKAAQTHVQRALRQTQLCAAFIQPQHVHMGERLQAYRRGADAHLSAPITIGPQPVAGGDGPVQRRSHPFGVGFRRGKRHRARDIIEPAHLRWRIGKRQRGTRQQRRRNPQFEEIHHAPPRKTNRYREQSQYRFD